VTGEWEITFHTTESTYQNYIDLNTTYRIHIQQHEQVIEGLGEKWRENGEDIEYALHTPISLEGDISGGKLSLIYTLQGAERTTYGTVDVEVNKDGRFLIGKFS
jgi:hypothetical protein